MMMGRRSCFSLMWASLGVLRQGTLAFVTVSLGRHLAMANPHIQESSGGAAAERRSQTDPTVEILNSLFPPRGQGGVNGIEGGLVPSYAQRMEAGRAAQGFLTTDSSVARTLVPPRELTYGEFNLDFFLDMVEECLHIRAGDGSERRALESEASKLVFGDMGAGCGRLVVAQALTWPWRYCRGVEKVESLHGMGSEALLRAGRMTTDPTLSPDAQRLLGTMVPCFLSLGDVNDDEVDISDVDVLFCYSSSFPAFGDLLTEFSYTLGHKLRCGAQVITTDRRLVSDGPWEFCLVRQREGINFETGGKSTAYLWQVVRSALGSKRQ